MKKSIKIFASAFALTLVFAFGTFAQCEAKKISFPAGNTISLSGKTGGCNRFAVTIADGLKVSIKLVSTDSKARFDLQSGSEDETGSALYPDLTTFNNYLEGNDWEIGIKGTAQTAYTLKIAVTDE